MIESLTDIGIFVIYSILLSLICIVYIKDAKPNPGESIYQYLLYYFGGYVMLPLLISFPLILMECNPKWGALIVEMIIFLFFTIIVFRKVEICRRDMNNLEKIKNLKDDGKQYKFIRREYQIYRILRWLMLIAWGCFLPAIIF